MEWKSGAREFVNTVHQVMIGKISQHVHVKFVASSELPISEKISKLSASELEKQQGLKPNTVQLSHGAYLWEYSTRHPERS